MSGKVAAARAYLSAGNTKLALQNLEDALKDNPEDGAALEARCDVLRELDRLDEAEMIARGWLARTPHDARAHIQLIVTLFMRQNGRGARRAMDAFREANPWDMDSHDYLETLYQARFGNQTKGLDTLAERAKHAGDKRAEFRLSSYAAEKRNNIAEAIMEAEFARRVGDDSAELAAYLAMLCFRAFRLRECRKYAREALAKSPGMPIPTELIYLSWIVLIPPFFFAQFFQFVWTKIGSGSIGGWFSGMALGVIVIPPLAAVSHHLMAALMARLHISYGWDASFWLFLAWSCYLPLIGTGASLIMRKKPKEIRIADY